MHLAVGLMIVVAVFSFSSCRAYDSAAPSAAAPARSASPSPSSTRVPAWVADARATSVAYLGAANSLREAGDLDAALLEARRAEAMMPGDADATTVMGQIRAQQAAVVRVQQAERVDPRRLAANPQAYTGKDLIVQGKALTVTQQADYTWIQLMAIVPDRPSLTESVVIELRPKSTDVLREECYVVFGVGAGEQPVTRQLTGASGNAPFVRGEGAKALRARDC